ncbi:hypothetical protein EDC96DRAFT_500741 [Choanephora cucurbitarum]|nr:hypothetical protein EDC96DRAFT_500741 [Choanephora cucurbitarum]
MMLIFVLLCFSLLIYFITKVIVRANKQTTNTPSGLLEAANLELLHTPLPVLIRVYLIGIFETIYITCCHRGLFKHATTHRDNEKLIDDWTNAFQGPCGLAVITGGDSGIGREITHSLLTAGFQVILGTHSVQSCQQVMKELSQSTGSDKLSCIPLDLASVRSVYDFVDQVKLKAPNKDIQLLINNAGVMNVPYQSTMNGFESQCQINLLSPMLLTEMLLPWIDRQCGRVLFASSSTLYAIRNLDTSWLKTSYRFQGLDHYAYSKACVAQLVSELAKTTDIKIYAYHPGTVRTRLFAHTVVFSLPIVSKLFDFIMFTPKEGSQTPLYLCLTKEPGVSGTYWANMRPQALPCYLINGKKENTKALWHSVFHALESPS